MLVYLKKLTSLYLGEVYVCLFKKKKKSKLYKGELHLRSCIESSIYGAFGGSEGVRVQDLWNTLLKEKKSLKVFSAIVRDVGISGTFLTFCVGPVPPDSSRFQQDITSKKGQEREGGE